MKKYSFVMTFLLCFTVALSPVTACTRVTPPAGNGGIVSTVVPEAKFESVSNGGSGSVGEGQSFTLDIDAEADGKNYMKILLQTSVPLFGKVDYSTTDGSHVSEDFYIAASENEFRMILDFYQDYMGIETVDSVTFSKVNGGGNITVSEVSLAEFPVSLSGMGRYRGLSDPDDFQIYLAGEGIKIGCSLESGGALNFLSYDGAKVCRTVGGVYVGVNCESKDNFLSVEESGDVNLLNLYDNGRLVQQSYYGISEPPYNPGIYNGSTWKYNPVQGGSQTNGCSTIVDLRVGKNEIYVKTRPLDWAHDFSLTKSYMENWYTIEKSAAGVEYVRVKNAFTDFSGYTHGSSHQELPAFYGIAPLGKAVYYSGSTPFTGDTLTEKGDFGFWAAADNAENKIKCTENWISWVNEDDWGLGLYVPSVTSVFAGRTFSYYTNYYDSPSESPETTYAAPLINYTIRSYTTFGYEYYLTAGELSLSRSLFADLHNGGAKNAQIESFGTPTW